MKEEATLRERLKNSATRAAAREELRQRILEIVEQQGETSDVAIWHASAPAYLPWDFMLAEIKALHADQRLRLEIAQPGYWIVRSLACARGAKETNRATRRSGNPRGEKTDGPAPKRAPQTKAVKTPVKAAAPTNRKGGARSGKTAD